MPLKQVVSTLYEGAPDMFDQAHIVLIGQNFYICKQLCRKKENIKEKFLTTCGATGSLFQSSSKCHLVRDMVHC